MVDTIRMKVLLPVTTRTAPKGWMRRGSTTLKADALDGMLDRHDGLRFEHEHTGLMMGGRAPFLSWLQVSLARLLFGHNGRLISSESELRAAFDRLVELLSEICDPILEGATFTRADLVWQFSGLFAHFANAYRTAKFKGVRKEGGGYERESMFWKGSAMHLRIYDKVRQITKKQPGNVLRVEIQLHNPKFKKLLGDGEAVTELSFQRCFNVYRKLMQGFAPTKIPSASTIAELFVMADLDGYKPQGKSQSQFEYWAAKHSPRQVSRMRQQMAAVRLETFEHDFFKLFPKEGLPPIVEVDEYGSELPHSGSRPCSSGEPTAAGLEAPTSARTPHPLISHQTKKQKHTYDRHH